jgi:hypothetical protein
MPLHFAALAPSSSSIASFISKQLKDPAMQALGMDTMSRAFRQATRSFLVALQNEFQRHSSLPTLMQESVEASVSEFVNAESVQEVLATPFRDVDSFDIWTIARLWTEIPGPGGIGKLVELPPSFDWDAVGASYLEAVRALQSEKPELRELWVADNVEQIKRIMEKLRGIGPRFSLEDYRRVLIEDFGYLKLSAIRADSTLNFCDTGVPLQDVYIPQQVKEAFPPRDLSRDYRKKLQIQSRLHGASNEFELSDLVEAYRRAPVRRMQEVLADPACSRLVILGDPGLGKSTLLQYLALNWAQRISSTIPFLIELRKYTRDHAHPRSFLEFLENGTWSPCRLPQSELDHYLRERDSVLLFDGLDEVFDDGLRGNIVAEIISFSRAYPNAKVIVTTRVMGYAIGSPNPAHFGAAQFRQFTLQDFDDSRISEFIHKFYSATVSDINEKEGLIARLIIAIGESNAIRELAGNPLLLTMMVLLNRRKHLPRERLRLYEACAELLVEGWDAARHLTQSQYLTLDDKFEILQTVAFEMQQERDGLAGNMISESRLKTILVAALRDRNVTSPKLAAQKIVEALGQRDFMLCSTGDEQFAFVHRTYLEFFCAREYMGRLANAHGKDELITLFRERWPDDAWHEVLRLICAMAGPDLAAELVTQLLQASTREGGWRAIFLAAECVAEIRLAGRVDSLRASIKKNLITLLDFEATGQNQEIRDAVDTETVAVRKGALSRIARFWSDEATQNVLKKAIRNQYWAVRYAAAEALVRLWKGEATRQWFVSLLNESELVIQAAVHGLALGWPDEESRRLLLGLVNSPDNNIPRYNIIEELSRRWPEKTSWEWLRDQAIQDMDPLAATSALNELARRWTDGRTKDWLLEYVRAGKDKRRRYYAARELIRNWPRKSVEKELLELAEQNENVHGRDAALVGLIQLRDDAVRDFVLHRMNSVSDPEARSRLIYDLVWIWPDDKTMLFLIRCAQGDRDASVRGSAIHQLSRHWRAQSITCLLGSRSDETDADTRIRFLQELVRQWPDDRSRHLVQEIAAGDPSADVRVAALQELSRVWPDVSTKQFVIMRSTRDLSESVRQVALRIISFNSGSSPGVTPDHSDDSC